MFGEEHGTLVDVGHGLGGMIGLLLGFFSRVVLTVQNLVKCVCCCIVSSQKLKGEYRWCSRVARRLFTLAPLISRLPRQFRGS